MLDYQKTGKLLLDKRKEFGLTQKQLADQLGISFQAVSRWEKGLAMPTVELLDQLSMIFNITVDEIIKGEENTEYFSYYRSGIDFSLIDLISHDLNRLAKSDEICHKKNAFRGSAYDLYPFSTMHHPVLVSKIQEPGTKQKLAFQYGYHAEIIEDIVHTLINDMIMVGARPLFICPSLIGAQMERDFVVKSIDLFKKIGEKYRIEITRNQTSIQPHTITQGNYLINTTMIGIVEQSLIPDYQTIQSGDIVLGIASNGLHHYGYALIYSLLEKKPWLKNETMHHANLLDELMKPQFCYSSCLMDLIIQKKVKAVVNIIGGGIPRHVKRIAPEGLCAEIDLSKIKVLPIFKFLKQQLNISETEMLSTFNCGIGMVVVVSKEDKDVVLSHIRSFFDCQEIGKIISGNAPLHLSNHLSWN